MFHVKHPKKCETWIKIEVNGENVSRETFTNLWDGVNDI